MSFFSYFCKRFQRTGHLQHANMHVAYMTTLNKKPVYKVEFTPAIFFNSMDISRTTYTEKLKVSMQFFSRIFQKSREIVQVVVGGLQFNNFKMN